MLTTDPIDFLLDDNNDIVFENHGAGFDLVLSSGILGVAQGIRIALNMIQGEWFIGPTIGVPYFTTTLGTKFDINAMRQTFTSEIKKVTGVSEITRLAVSFDSSSRVATVDFIVKTAFGDTITDKVVI